MESGTDQISELETRNEMLQAQLAEAQKMSSVGVLASSITHEFNNILMTVINYAKMGLRHKDVATRDKAFDRILSAGQRASKITTGMLAYARNGSDHREPMDLTQLVEDVLVLVEKDLSIHRVRVEARFSCRPMAPVNSSQIQQVLMNLIINARQAMGGGGSLTLTVQTSPDGKWAEISVGDAGPGIPQDHLQRIFDPFFSTKQADQAGQGGTGLGLSLCRDILEAHKGRIRVESTPGQGTTFTLRLPFDGTMASDSASYPAAVVQKAG